MCLHHIHYSHPDKGPRLSSVLHPAMVVMSMVVRAAPTAHPHPPRPPSPGPRPGPVQPRPNVPTPPPSPRQSFVEEDGAPGVIHGNFPGDFDGSIELPNGLPLWTRHHDLQFHLRRSFFYWDSTAIEIAYQPVFERPTGQASKAQIYEVPFGCCQLTNSQPASP